MRSYVQFFEMHEGDPQPCLELNCAIARLEYDEWFRMDVHNSDGTTTPFFHRGRSYMEKLFDVTVPLFFSEDADAIL